MASSFQEKNDSFSKPHVQFVLAASNSEAEVDGVICLLCMAAKVGGVHCVLCMAVTLLEWFACCARLFGRSEVVLRVCLVCVKGSACQILQ